MRVLVTGATGFVGGRIAAYLAGAGYGVVVTHRRESGATASVAGVAGLSVPFELVEPASITAALERAGAEVVVHAAAMAGLGACERRREEARAVNVDGTKRLAEACRAIGARLLFLSTDQVFGGEPPGRGADRYNEQDAPSPVNFYGQTKVEAERVVLGVGGDVTVVRLALVVGRSVNGGRSSSEQLIAMIKGGAVPTLYRDEFRTPVCVGDVCRAVEALLAVAGVPLVHVGGPERMNRVELGQRILRLAQLSQAYEAVEVPPPVDGEAVRPKEVSLDSSLAERSLGWRALRLEEWRGEFA